MFAQLKMKVEKVDKHEETLKDVMDSSSDDRETFSSAVSSDKDPRVVLMYVHVSPWK